MHTKPAFKGVVVALVAGAALGPGDRTYGPDPDAIEAVLTNLVGISISCNDSFSYEMDTMYLECQAAEDTIPLPLGDHGEHDVWNVNGFSQSIYGVPVAVAARQASELTRIHERAHTRQGALATPTVPDYVLYYSLREADARLAEVIAVYRRYITTGNRDWWDEMYQSDPVMVYVFNRLLADDVESQESLRNGGLPSVRIMQRTALSYFLTSTADRAIDTRYASEFENFEQRLGQEPVTLRAEQLANAIKQEGVSYLLGDPTDPARPNLTDPWLLYQGLRFGLDAQEEAVLASYTRANQIVERQTASVSAEERIERLLSFRRGRAPLWRAYAGAGLARFWGEMDRSHTALSGPHPRIRVGQPEEQQPRPCPNAHILAKTGMCL